MWTIYCPLDEQPSFPALLGGCKPYAGEVLRKGRMQEPSNERRAANRSRCKEYEPKELTPIRAWIGRRRGWVETQLTGSTGRR